MFGEYIRAALKRAECIPLEDGTYAAHVDGLRGLRNFCKVPELF